MTKRITFTVTGNGEFPFDMLRYDEAFPADSSSACAMTAYGRRAVTLRTDSNPHKNAFPGNRWESFGWMVTEYDGQPSFAERAKASA